MIAVHAARVFDGLTMHSHRCVVIDGGRIVAVTDEDASAAHHLSDDMILAPGFVDLQVNGGGGVMFNDALDRDGLRRITEAHAALGTTSLLATLISGTRPAIAAAIAAVRAASDLPGLAGLHIEGPFIAPTRRGIHPADHIIDLGEADVAALTEAVGGLCLLVTLAPERVSPTLITRLAGAGMLVFAGHSDAGYDDAAAGFASGIVGVTHLFNAMSPLASRAPGLVGTTLASRDIAAGIIVDAIHVHPASVAAAHAAMGPDRLFLVSDAMATTGSDAQSFWLYGHEIRLRDGRLTDTAGTLAGAHLSMADAVRCAVSRVGIALADALRMATATPARHARLTDRGRLAPGCRADLVALDANLAVRHIWQAGIRLS